MATKPIQVSIEVDLLEQIDADPEVQERGRSAFIRSALRLYLRAKEKRTIDAEISAAYTGKASELADEVADLLSRQTWPAD